MAVGQMGLAGKNERSCYFADDCMTGAFRRVLFPDFF